VRTEIEKLTGRMSALEHRRSTIPAPTAAPLIGAFKKKNRGYRCS